MNRINKVVILGAGNLGTQLALALSAAKLEILQIYSRTNESAGLLANKIKSPYTTNLKELNQEADLYIFALSDKALQAVLDQIPLPIGDAVHTAGSIPMDMFNRYTESYGVFYPFQTFSKNRTIDFSNIPICIESNNLGFQDDLKELAGRISKTIHLMDSTQRKQLHLAAVFTCNFANHMYSIGQKLLEEKDVDFELLKPLIKETAEKVQELDPLSAQTGPAIRFDEEIVTKHENELKDNPNFQKIYRFVSKSIIKMHNKLNE